MSELEQLGFLEVGKADRRLPLKAWELLVKRLERRSHGCRQRALLGAPRSGQGSDQ